ncbi:MAG: WYL domain-containing protein [Clostridia bacterium]|nr:WYL domain-containing protein [Clostridia bacterium]
MSDTKGRVLFLEHYLTEHTDEHHPITTEELIQIYEENGFKANRNTIRDDIKVLQSADVDVISDRVGNAKGHYICGRQFDLAELKTLVDAVSSSRFISRRKSEDLIKKITGLTNEQNRGYLTARIYMAERIKPETPGTFITVDRIATAIETGKKISFQYIDYLPTKEVILRHDGKRYIASPYCFLWNDDRYYVPSFSEEKDCVIPYRVDRMRNVEVTAEDAIVDESFNPSEYSKTVLKMFDGNLDETEVMLIAENRFMLNVLDRFGEDIETSIADDRHFRAIVRVRPSTTFFSWVFQFSGQITIAGPESVKQSYELMLDTVKLCQKG